jgi:hypothetical protein
MMSEITRGRDTAQEIPLDTTGLVPGNFSLNTKKFSHIYNFIIKKILTTHAIS